MSDYMENSSARKFISIFLIIVSIISIILAVIRLDSDIEFETFGELFWMIGIFIGGFVVIYFAYLLYPKNENRPGDLLNSVLAVRRKASALPKTPGIAAEREDVEKATAEREAVEREAVEKAAAEMAAIEREAAEKAAEKAAAEKAAAEMAAIERETAKTPPTIRVKVKRGRDKGTSSLS